MKLDPFSFQSRVRSWAVRCFGEAVADDHVERTHRFLEEAMELAQARGCTKEEALGLLDYVFSRAAGDPVQEVGGVAMTLAALCSASDIDMENAAQVELGRVEASIEKIRAKQAAKPRHSPLPQ